MKHVHCLVTQAHAEVSIKIKFKFLNVLFQDAPNKVFRYTESTDSLTQKENPDCYEN